MENALAESSFLPVHVENEVAVQTNEAGEFLVVDGIEVPLLTTMFQAVVVHPGSIATHPEYKLHIGKLYFPELDQSFEEVRVLPLTIVSRGRAMYLSAFSEGAENHAPDCYSRDGVFPASMGAAHTQCTRKVPRRDGGIRYEPVCQHAQWSNGRPQCQEHIQVAFLCIENPEMVFPFTLRFRGTGLSSWNEYFRRYLQTKNIARLRKRSIYDYATKLKVVLEKAYAQVQLGLEYTPDWHLNKYMPVLEWYLHQLIMESAAPQAAEPENPLPEVVEEDSQFLEAGSESEMDDMPF